ncbi:MAG: hypothetical protein HY912_20005 [Desulfomonile tiedjei]|uniref:Uncharacterized protein n=1 Tax=Desulfomonile tiedjei TaxID=2358 RepID=A0A9D6V4P0_9BACT|nr:hypothetical protein [Desulfomonile tiedjei]
MPRVLHYFHITHTGSETHGDSSARTESWILEEWDEIEKIVVSLDLPPEKTRLYQDGLPDWSICGYRPVNNTYPTKTAIQLLELDHEHFKSPNGRILLNLVRKGCRLMVTEDRLLLRAGDLLRENVELLVRNGQQSFLESDVAKLCQRRDVFISSQINSTLEPEEIGVLFLGKHHQITELAPDIKVNDYFK